MFFVGVGVCSIWHVRKAMALSCTPEERRHTFTGRVRHASKFTRVAVSVERKYASTRERQHKALLGVVWVCAVSYMPEERWH